jgi:hypothetical protein
MNLRVEWVKFMELISYLSNTLGLPGSRSSGSICVVVFLRTHTYHTHTHTHIALIYPHTSSSTFSKLEMMRQSFLIRSFSIIPLFLCFLTYSQQQQQQQQLLPIPVLVNDVEATYALFFFSHTHTHILVGYKNGVSRFQT